MWFRNIVIPWHTQQMIAYGILEYFCEFQPIIALWECCLTCPDYIETFTPTCLQVYEALIEREEDVIKLRNGEIKVKHLPPRNKQTRNEAFIRYLSIFYDRPTVKVRSTMIKTYVSLSKAMLISIRGDFFTTPHCDLWSLQLISRLHNHAENLNPSKTWIG
mgnify:CR=1 FL=1